MEIEQLIEWLTNNLVSIAILISVGVTGSMSWWSIRKISQHHKHDSKIASARLIRELREPWRKNGEFKDFVNEMDRNPETVTGNREIRMFLKQMEIVAIFWKDGLLDDYQLKELFGSDLDYVRNIKPVKKYLDDHTDKYHFTKLNELLKKSADWTKTD